MASAATDPPTQETAAELPDYLTSPNAVLKDIDVQWRYGRAPDYSNTRKAYDQSTFPLPHPCPPPPPPPVPSTSPTNPLSPRSKAPHPPSGLFTRPSRQPRKKLGNRSLLQTVPERLAHNRPRELLLFRKRRPTPDRRAHARSRHLQRYHLPKRIL
jgi:hypothetical protein